MMVCIPTIEDPRASAAGMIASLLTKTSRRGASNG
jgi:hypothetical protein